MSQNNDADPPFLHEEWCVVLRNAVAGTTYQQVAAATGYSRAHIAPVFGGRKRPTADELLRLAAALRLSPLRMLDLAGHLPGVSQLLTYVDRLEDQASRTSLAAGRVPVDDVHGASVIAGKAAAGGNYRVTIEPLWQGTGDMRRHYADLVAFEPIKPMSVTEMRSNLEDLLHHELAWFTAGFIGSPGTARHLPTPYPELVVNVPRLVAIRKGATTPLVGAPHTLCVLGGPWAGSADVASLLGYAFDFDYSHVGFVASRAFSRITHRWDHGLFGRDRLEVVRTYLAGSELGRSRVWAAGGDGYAETARLLAADKKVRSPLIVHLRPTDSLIEWTAWARTEWGHHDVDLDADRRTAAAERLVTDRQLASLGDRVVAVDVDPPSATRIDRQGDHRDAFADLWTELAEEVLQALAARRDTHFDHADALRRMRDGGR